MCTRSEYPWSYKGTNRQEPIRRVTGIISKPLICNCGARDNWVENRTAVQIMMVGKDCNPASLRYLPINHGYWHPTMVRDT